MSDRARLPFGFANATRRDGAAVVKEYEGNAAADRWATEVAALADVADLLPVPRILEATEDPPVLRMAYVEGSPASTALTEDALHRMGVLLRDFQDAYRARTRLVRVHGDFGPNNVLLSPDGAIAALIDWEWSRFGDPLVDAAWMEWALRIHYPGADPAPFYDGYGRMPSWEDRHLSMVESVTWRARRWISDPRTWDARLDATLRLAERA
jgi:aminoglycoside phosphotransferase (APT) family kinase protein